jgi:hypothetical protein
MNGAEPAGKASKAVPNWRKLKGEDAISVLLFFPAAYLLHDYWPSPFAFLGLIGVGVFIHLFFSTFAPGFAAIAAGICVGFLYGRAAYLLGINIFAAAFITVAVYPVGYLAGALAAQSLFQTGRRQHGE